MSGPIDDTSKEVPSSNSLRNLASVEKEGVHEIKDDRGIDDQAVNEATTKIIKLEGKNILETPRIIGSIASSTQSPGR